ncbi:MAG: replicative DNA helicase, partial [Planctomycetes bacterium]|nr:replicative DNA helicase [Planctomycetota bacterium]
SDTHTIQSVLVEVQQQIETFRRMRSEHDALAGLPSGYTDLDKITTGFKGGELIVLAARPGHGKTALALNIAEHIAISADRREHKKSGGGGCAVFSLEMRASELVSRMLCSLAGVSLRDVRNGNLSQGDENNLRDATERLAQSPLFIDDSFTISMAEIRAKCRRLKERYDIECVMVDYIQLISGDSGVDRHELIGRYSRGLKALARELNVPVFALSQLNRQIEQRRGVQQRPMLSDLRESGSIEQDADMVMFIQRDRMLSAEEMKRAQQEAELLEGREKFNFLDVEPATLVVAKNRSGPIGDVTLSFRKSCTRFEAMELNAHAHFASS